jgi:hypothetical protein
VAEPLHRLDGPFGGLTIFEEDSGRSRNDLERRIARWVSRPTGDRVADLCHWISPPPGTVTSSAPDSDEYLGPASVDDVIAADDVERASRAISFTESVEEWPGVRLFHSRRHNQ